MLQSHCTFLYSADSVSFIKDEFETYLTYQEKMGDEIEMSTAENIFGSVSKFLTPQTSPRPTFSFNIGVVGRTPNSSWTPFNLMMAPIQK